MPFNRPSMDQLVERVASDIEARVPGSDAHLRRSNLGVLSRVEAGVAHGLYGFINWAAKQAIPDTAESEILERWASVWGISRVSSAAAAGTVQLTGNNGVVVPAGTTLQRSDGATFTTAAAVTISGGAATVTVTALEPGTAGNTTSATKLTLAAQVIGVNANAAVGVDGLTGGSEIEVDESLRDRLLDRIKNPPQGGATRDYEAWAREVPGVTRVWVKPQWMGDGTVGVFFVRDNDASNIPSSEEVAEVQAYIDERRPVTADVLVIAPVELLVPMTITVVPDTPEVRAAVQAELRDVFRREAEPEGTLLISHLREAVSLSLGEIDHDIEVPGGNVVAGPGEIPALGAITWG